MVKLGRRAICVNERWRCSATWSPASVGEVRRRIRTANRRMASTSSDAHGEARRGHAPQRPQAFAARAATAVFSDATTRGNRPYAPPSGAETAGPLVGTNVTGIPATAIRTRPDVSPGNDFAVDLCGNQNFTARRAASPRRPPRHRRDAWLISHTCTLRKFKSGGSPRAPYQSFVLFRGGSSSVVISDRSP